MVSALKAYERRRGRRHVLIWIAALISLFGILAAFNPTKYLSSGVMLRFGVMIFLVLVVVCFVGTPKWLLRRRLPKSLPLEQTWRFSEEGVEISSNIEDSRLSWNTYCGFAETEDYFYLLPSPRILNILPKSSFAAPEDVKAFRELVTRKIGAAK